MVLKKITAALWILVAVLIVLAGTQPSQSSAQANSFVFTAHGDHGPHDSPPVLESLHAVAETGAAFSLALGDLSYEHVGDEQRWCDTVHQILGPDYPFEIVMGNHEDEYKVNGYIGNYVKYCPDHMNAQGVYGAEYYFDYPASDPLMRVIMIGADNSWDLNGNGSFEGNEIFDYNSASPANKAHLDWLANAIDSAREAGVPWVVVGMHKNCLTVGTKSCEIGSELMNLLVDKKVDLILQGHDHTYQRSKQLALGPMCPSIQPNKYNSSCVADDGSEGIYAKGAGSVLIITGHFGGRELYDISPDDPEAGYFVKALGKNGWIDFLHNDGLHSDVSNGFVSFEVSKNQIVVTHVATTTPTTFSDSFVISSDKTPKSTPEAATALTPSPTSTPAGPSAPTPTPIAPSSGTSATMSFVPVADTYVNAEKPDSNYGGSSTLRTDASPDIHSYLRFDTTGIRGVVQRATLRVYANTASKTGYDVYAVSDNNWTESDLTYASAPAESTKVATSGPVTAETWTTVDVTSLITGSGMFDLALTTTDTTATSYSSREGENPPELIVEFEPAAPPAADALTPTEMPSALILTPAADAYVQAVSPDENRGSGPYLRTDVSPEIRSYLRFEPAGVNGSIVRATLHLYAHTASSTGYAVHSVARQPWSETDVSYTTAPAIGDTLVLSNAINAETWTTVDVTALMNGNHPLTLALTTSGRTAVKYSSREGMHPPELVIEFYPAPASSGLTPAVTQIPTNTPRASETPDPMPATPTATPLLSFPGTRAAN